MLFAVVFYVNTNLIVVLSALNIINYITNVNFTIITLI